MTIETQVTLDDTHQRFVISAGGGVSCLGYPVVSDYIRTITDMVAEALNKANNSHRGVLSEMSGILDSKEGTLEQYQGYCKLLSIASKFNLGTYYSSKTPKKVRQVLNRAIKEGLTLRVFYGKDGEDWMEENDTIGKIGRSSGTLKVPLLLLEDGLGGSAILTDSIVRIIDVISNKELYRHDSYRFKGPFSIVDFTDEVNNSAHKSHAVTVNNETYARFDSFEMAASYVSFLAGNSHSKPWDK